MYFRGSSFHFFNVFGAKGAGHKAGTWCAREPWKMLPGHKIALQRAQHPLSQYLSQHPLEYRSEATQGVRGDRHPT